MGRVITALSADSGRIVFFRFQWLWDAGYWVFARFAPTRALTQRLIARVGGPGLLRLIGEVNPDVIVSTYPNTMEALARCSTVEEVLALHIPQDDGEEDE